MKIGILTYHRAENYGALLQSYALKTYLKECGYSVSFVDYWPKYHEDYFKLFPLQQLKEMDFISKLKFFIKLILWSVPRFIKKKRLQRFMHKYLGVINDIKYRIDDRTDHYDIVVYGSDQIWRKQNLGGVGFDTWYFGSDNVFADKKIVYAGSMGKEYPTKPDKQFIEQMMENFSAISVREGNLKCYLGELGIKASLVLDPVFLLLREQWKQVFRYEKRNEKYILFYNLLNTPESEQFADKLGREMNLPIKELNKKMSFHNIGKRYIFTASVERFLELIEGAEYIVSNSFHGVAMSIILQKQFYAVGMGDKSNRVKSLLQSLNLIERYVEGNTIDTSLSQSIDYNQVTLTLQVLIDKSKTYLKNSL